MGPQIVKKPTVNVRVQRVDLIRMVAIFFVLLAHSPLDGEIRAKSSAFLIADFLANGSVPAFFMLSGYLGRRKIDDQRVDLRSYVNEKFRTLAVPFLFWNILVLALVFAMKSVGLESLSRGDAGGYFEVTGDMHSIAGALFGIHRNPLVYQFWFLRDLIIISPLSFIVCRYLPRLPFLPLVLFLIPLQTLGSMAFFLLGYGIQTHLQQYVPPSLPSMARFCAVWIICGWGTVGGWMSVPFPLQQIGSAIFVVFIALMLSASGPGRWLSAFAGSTFFVYAVHQPTESIVAKVLESCGWAASKSLVSFFLIPFFVFSICVLLHRFIRHYMPNLLPLMTGGR